MLSISQRSVPEMRLIRDAVIVSAEQYLRHSHVHQSLSEAAKQFGLDWQIPDGERLFYAAVNQLKDSGLIEC